MRLSVITIRLVQFPNQLRMTSSLVGERLTMTQCSLNTFRTPKSVSQVKQLIKKIGSMCTIQMEIRF